MKKVFCSTILLLLLFVLVSVTLGAGTKNIIIFYTNDLHDRILPDYDGVGGMPYVSGYIKSIKATHNNVLVLDAGDIMEKGDMVAGKTQSTIMYEAMGRAGYDVTVVGNHDQGFGPEHLKNCAELAGELTILSINYPEGDQTSLFPHSKIFDVDGVKVGVIGVTRIDDVNPDLEKIADLISHEADVFEDEVDMTVVVAHLGSKNCKVLAHRTPQIDLFISGHKHELLGNPVVVPETGALIVQAGSYANHVGHLEILVEQNENRISSFNNQLVELFHDKIPCDEEMLAWILERQQAVCPEASRVVTHLEDGIGWRDIGNFAAEALLAYSGQEISFCHTGVVIRNTIPSGMINMNLLFRCFGTFGSEIIETTVTGKQVERYIEGLMLDNRKATSIAGFEVIRGYAGKPITNLQAEHEYKVVMPKREYVRRFKQVFRETYGIPDDSDTYASVTNCDYGLTEVVAAYLKRRPE